VEAHIDCTDRMLDKLHARDVDGQKLRALQQYDQFWQTLEADVNERVESYQKDMREIHRVKKNTVHFCMHALRNEELASEKKSIQTIQVFESFRKHKMRDLNKMESKLGYLPDYENELLTRVDKLEDDLMTFEMSLQDALQIAVDKFKEKVNANITDMKAKTQNFINFCAEQASIFAQNLHEYALEEQVKFIEQMDEQENFQDNMTDEFNELLELLIEKDPLVVHLDNSKDFMDLGINKLETEIGKAINTEWNEILREMLEKQHKRNRNIIKEIIDTCETFRKGIKEDFTNLKGEEEDN